MSLKSEIFTKLTTDAGLSPLTGLRVFPDYADQRTALPYITYNDQSQESMHSLAGVVPSGLAVVVMQFNIWAADPDSRSDVEAALRKSLDGVQRQFYGSIFINHVKYINGVDTIEEPQEGSQDGAIFGKFMDFEIWHERDV